METCYDIHTGEPDYERAMRGNIVWLYTALKYCDDPFSRDRALVLSTEFYNVALIAVKERRQCQQ